MNSFERELYLAKKAKREAREREIKQSRYPHRFCYNYNIIPAILWTGGNINEVNDFVRKYNMQTVLILNENNNLIEIIETVTDRKTLVPINSYLIFTNLGTFINYDAEFFKKELTMID